MADMRNRSNVLVGAPDVKASGGAQIGDVAKGAQVPKDATTEVTDLNQAAVGYVSEDGITKTVDRSTEKIKDHNGDTIIVLTSDHSVMLKLTVMEAANAALLKAIFGTDNVTIDADGKKIKVADNADDLPHYSWQFDIKGGPKSKIRVFAPDGQVTNVGDVKYVRNDVIKYELEIECYTDDEGNKCYQYIDREEASTAPSSDDS
ncbi:hypothetical protein [Corynebacterium ulceribovis]|uniref:phage tail tube protein n=1 Tax=Corynebacterium ulceribovis TaxID=487732 RepID=UPI00036094B7|nr:hypothetical protein [Corynebacterium ulceribovis]